MKRLKKRLRKLMDNNVLKDKEFIKNIGKLFGSSLISQIIPFLLLPLLTRLYPPDDFGFWAYFLSLSGIFSLLMTGNYEFAIVLPKDKSEALRIAGGALSIASLMFLIGLIIFPFFGNIITKNAGMHGCSSLVVVWIPVTAFSMAVFRIVNYWNNRENRFNSIGIGNIVRSSSAMILQLVGGLYTSMGYSFLITGSLAGYFLGFSVQAVDMVTSLKQNRRELTFGKIKESLGRYLKFPKYFMPSEFLNYVSSNVPVIFLTNIFDAAVTGLYAVPHRFINTPLTMLGSSISQVYFKKSNEIKNSVGDLGIITTDIFKKLFMIGIIPLSLISGYGDYIFGFILGDTWAVSGVYASFLAPWMLMVFAASPISVVFATLEKQEVSLKLNIYLLFIRILSFVIGGIIFKSAMLAVFLYGASGFIFWLYYSFFVIKISGGNRNEIVKFVIIRLAGIMLPVVLSRGVFECMM
jgi:lipopolysaccharide exporter